MPINALRHGVGAECWILKKNIYPKRAINLKYPDYDKKHDKLEGCFLIREGEGHASKKIRQVYFFSHIDLPDRELYACKGFVHVSKEGDEAAIFGLEVVEE